MPKIQAQTEVNVITSALQPLRVICFTNEMITFLFMVLMNNECGGTDLVFT